MTIADALPSLFSPSPQPNKNPHLDNPNVSAIYAQRECSCLNPSGRNLVICIDGTLNQFNKMNSNVVELYHLLLKDKTQLTYYNSGIGTYVRDSHGLRSWFSCDAWRQWSSHTIDMMIAWNLKARILDAYQWLAENYVDGDRIFLFGFSRGAYQVRVIAGMLHRVGLLHKGNNEQIPFAYELYMKSVADEETEKPLCDHFKNIFSRPAVRAHFVGAWDTVSSVGFFHGARLPETANGMKHVCAFRHALALDERRVKFLPEYANGGSAPEGENVKEVWFAGSHSDIGGGNVPNEAGALFGPALRWMTYEAAYFGLRMRHHKGDWGRIPLNHSMGWLWRMVEYIPFLVPRTAYNRQSKIKNYAPHCAEPRQILEGQLIHQSVLVEIEKANPKYTPAPKPPYEGGWDLDILKQDKQKILERDWYAESGILSRIFESVKLNNKLPSSGDIHAFLTLASSGVGLYSIISQPSAIDMLIAICRAECEAAGNETQSSDDTLFETLLDVLTAFKTAPLGERIHAYRLLVDLEKFMVESLGNVDAVVCKRRCELLQKAVIELKPHQHFTVFLEPGNASLKSRVSELESCSVTHDLQAAHIALSTCAETKELRFDVVDTEITERGVALKPRFVPDTNEDLARVMMGLSHYYQYLKGTSDALKDVINKISISCFEVRDTGTGYPRIVKVNGARNLCKSNEINITVPNAYDPDHENPLYGFEVTNDSEDGGVLFPVLFYFDNGDFTISQCYPHSIGSGTNAVGALPHAKGQSMTIGFGLGAGSRVQPFSFYMRDDDDAEVGFFKLFLFKETMLDLRRILQAETIFQRTRGYGRSSLPPPQLEDIMHRGWGTITLTAIQRRGQPLA